VAEEQFSETFLTPLAGPMHLALLAAERFYSTHKRWPGTKELSDMAEDQREMEETVDDGYVESITEVYVKLPFRGIQRPRWVLTLRRVRGGFGCLPNTAAFLGGILGQEVLKLITRQYQTLDNTVIVDLVKSTLDKFRF
jgi:amyloid beta precursor protein binding protein 1